MPKHSTKQLRRITSPRRIELLVSPVRQEIVDSLAATGPSTIRQLGETLGMPADALYFHTRKLVAAGLVVARGARATTRRHAVVYALPARELAIEYDGTPATRRGVQRVIAAALRSADREFGAALRSGRAVTRGPGRNLSGGRIKGWLSPAELEKVNALLDEIAKRLRSSPPSDRRRLFSFTWALSPVRAKPARRTKTTGAKRGSGGAGAR